MRERVRLLARQLMVIIPTDLGMFRLHESRQRDAGVQMQLEDDDNGKVAET